MKKGLLLLWFVVNTLTLPAQHRFGNEWIQTGQRYLKISTNQTGVYRLSYDDINATDASFLQTNPANWQLFFRGQEVAIRVVGQQDGVFNAPDYIEFYGEANDGSQDSLLYRPQQRLHPYQTLFSDKTAYFLTTNPVGVGKRMPELNLSAQGLTPELFHIEKTVQALTSDYTFNNLKGIEPVLQQSFFEPGEGWSGPLLTTGSAGILQFKLPALMPVAWPIKLEGMVNGRDNSSHRIQVQADALTTEPIAPVVFQGFLSQTFETTVMPKSIQNEQITLRFTSEALSATNNFSITYATLSYPQALDMAGQPSKVFHLPPNTRATVLLSIKNAPSASVAYDITDKANCRYLTPQTGNGQTQVVVNETAQNRDVLLTNQFLKPLAVQSTHFATSFPKSADYLIVTHSSLRQSAATYASYRASGQGGSHQPFIIDADSLYDQFNYGERSPLALRRFADYMLANTAVKNMLLIGRAYSYPYQIKTTTDDLVPTIGYPGSDILLTAGLGGYSPNTPAIPTGRLNVTTNAQVLTYLEKVKQLENAANNGLWRKRIIHISGGKTKGEAQSLKTALSRVGETYQNGLLGGQVNTFSKTSADEVEPINIAPLVNEGVSLITFFGHAGPAVTDMNFGFATPLENGFRNQNYPLMIFNGCGVGEIFSKFNTLSTDWLLAPQKGAGIVLAHSYWSFEAPTTRYLTKLYNSLFADPTTLGMPFGKLQQRLSQDFEKDGIGPYDESVLLGMILQGDPALSIYPLPNPDFSVEQNDMHIESSVVGSSLKNSDSLRIVIPLSNVGKFVAGQTVAVSVKKITSTGTTSGSTQFNAFRYRDTLVYTLAKDEALQKIEVSIDPDNKLIELSKTNNKATLVIDWAQARNSTSYPPNALPDRISPEINVFVDGKVREKQAVVGVNPRVDIYVLDENPLSPQDSSGVDVYLKRCETCAPQKLSANLLSVSAISANQLLVATSLSLTAGSTYQLIVYGKDAAGNKTQSPYVLDISVVATDLPVTLLAYPNPATTYVRFDIGLNVLELPTEARLQIYNQVGQQVFDTNVRVSTGKNVFLWQPTTPPGLYPYSLRLTWKDGRTETHSGRVVWQH